MKLKDIVPYCLESPKSGEVALFRLKYYWVIAGVTYGIESLQKYSASQFLEHNYDPYSKFFEDGSCDYINLSRYSFINPNETSINYNDKDNYLSLNLNHDITIFKNFIMVHKTDSATNEYEDNVFYRTNYFVANGHECHAHHYTIGLYATDSLGGMVTDLRIVFKDLIHPPAPPKPAELTLDDRVDDLIDELMKDSRTMAIKKLKRMLNERI